MVKAINNKKYHWLEEGTTWASIGKYQGGFSKGWSCIERIMNIKLIFRNHYLKSNNLVIHFVDVAEIEKAYDHADTDMIFAVREESDTVRKALPKNITYSKYNFLGRF